MKNKQEIADKWLGEFWIGQIDDAETVEGAMEEHAKEVAIGFHKWVTKNYWHVGDNEWMET